MLRSIIKTALFIIITVIVFGCQNDKNKTISHSNAVPELNLTENALWDKPILQEADRDSLYALMNREYSPKFIDFLQKMHRGNSTLKEVELIYDTLKNSQSKYAGYARLITLNQILIDTPMEKFSKEYILDCLAKGFKIAQGSAPVSQSLFFNFWDNCMVALANNGNYDEVSLQAQKLLEICENQNLPVGVMFSYRALAGNLQDHHDYSTALMEYEKADKIARECFPKLLGDNWLTSEGMEENIKMSDYMACYVDMKSQELYCCINDSNYEWIKKNEKFIHQLINTTKSQTVSQVCMTYNLAQYYDAMGNNAKFREYLKRGEDFKAQQKNIEGTFLEFMFVYNYNQSMAYHELNNNRPEEALRYMRSMNPEWLSVQNDETFARIYLKLGLYKDAAEMLNYLLSKTKEDLDGRNRLTLSTMSTNIENKKRDIQMMQAEIDRQHMQRKYDFIILGLAFILIGVLVFFLIRQHKLNKRLAVALDKAEAANRAKSLFLKNMTHEIHTPIHQIYGFAQIMADRSTHYGEEEIHEMCDVICESSKHLTKIADNIVEVVDKVSELNDLETTESVLQ